MESSLEGNGGDLMDQCSWHDTPPAFSVNLTNWLGHDLDIGLSALESRVLTSQWLGGKNAPFEANLPVPLGDTSAKNSRGVGQRICLTPSPTQFAEGARAQIGGPGQCRVSHRGSGLGAIERNAATVSTPTEATTVNLGPARPVTAEKI